MDVRRRSEGRGVLLLLVAAVLILGACSRTPKLEGRVTDTAHVLSAIENDRISHMLATYELETSHQLAVLTVPSIDGESIESFSLRVANDWGLGQKGVNNGILVILSMRERAARIELGKGFEPYISDAKAQDIMNESMVPAFVRAQYAAGIEAGLSRLMAEGRNFVVSGVNTSGAQK